MNVGKLSLFNWVIRLAGFYQLWDLGGGGGGVGYSTSFPPKQIPSTIGNGPALWIYISEDAHGTVAAAGYFTNGFDLGMKVGDAVFVGKSTATIGYTVHYVQTVVTNGAATISAAILA